MLNDKGSAYQLISNLLHRRVASVILKEGKSIGMSDEEIEEGTDEIQKKIEGFDYTKSIKEILDDDALKELYRDSSSNYEKLHLFRILFGESIRTKKSTIIAKFINVAFHIENDYIYQLNPCDYQLVPQYVIDECDKQMSILDKVTADVAGN